MDLKACAIVALALCCVCEGKTRPFHGHHKQRAVWAVSGWSECSGGCGGGIQTRAVRCIDVDGMLSEQCSRDVPLPYQFCQGHENCPTSGESSATALPGREGGPLAHPTDKHFLSNPDGSTSVVLLHNHGDDCLIYQNTSSLDGLEVTCTSRCTDLAPNCRIIPPSYSVTDHPSGGVVISLHGKQIMLPRPVASIDMRGATTLTYTNNLLAVRGVGRYGVTAFHLFDNVLLYTFNGGMSRKHFQPGKLFICGSSVLFSYNAHLARQIDNLYSNPAIPLSSPDTAQLDKMGEKDVKELSWQPPQGEEDVKELSRQPPQGEEDVKEQSWQISQAQKVPCIPPVVPQGLPYLIPTADSNQLPALLKPVPLSPPLSQPSLPLPLPLSPPLRPQPQPPPSKALCPQSQTVQPSQSPIQLEFLSPTAASKASISPSANAAINYETRPLPSPLHPLSNHSTVSPLTSPPPYRSPHHTGTSQTVPLQTVVIFNGSKMASPMVIPVTTGVELQVILEENKLVVVAGGRSVIDLGSSVCIPVPPHCLLCNTGGILAFKDCEGNGRSIIANEVMVFDGADIRGVWSEGVVARGAVMVHEARQGVLVSQSATFSRVVCNTLELMQKGVVFEFSLNDAGHVALWSGGMLLVQISDVAVIDMKSTSHQVTGYGEPTMPKSLYSFNGTHLTERSEHNLLTGTDTYLYVTKTSALYSNDPILNGEMETWLSSLHPQFEIRALDDKQSVLYVAGDRVIDLSAVHVIGTLGTEQLWYGNETLVVVEATGTQTSTVSVPSVSQLAVLTYGNSVAMLYERSAPMAIRGGGQLYLGNQGAFYCVNKDINTAIGHHLVAKVVAMATSLSLFSITLSDLGTEEGGVVQLSFNGTNILNLRGSTMTTLLPGSMITYLDRTLSIQKEGLPIQAHRSVARFFLFDGLQLLNYSGSGPSAIVPEGSLYLDSGTAFYTESSLLVAQIASILDLGNADSEYSLTPQKACQCLALDIAPTSTPPQVASLLSGGRGQGFVARRNDNAALDAVVDTTHMSCDSGTCTCACNLQQLSPAQEHKGFKYEQQKDVPEPHTPVVVPSATADGTISLHAPPHVTKAGQVTGRGSRSTTSDGASVTRVTPYEGTIRFELAVASSSRKLILYLNGTDVLDLSGARRVSVPADCSVVSDGSSLQVTSTMGTILHWYSNVASLVVFEDTPLPPSRSSSTLPLSGGGQLFVDSDRAFYSLSDPLSTRLVLHTSLPSLSSAPLLSFEYSITSSRFLVSLLARGRELLVLDDLSVKEVEERPTLILEGEGLVLVEGNSTSSFPDVASLSVTDGVNLWSYSNIQLSVEPGLLMVWEGGALYSSSFSLNEHISQLILNAQMSQPCINTIVVVQKGVVSVLLHGNPVAEIKPENGDVCLSVDANQGFLLVNGSILDTVSGGIAFRGVGSMKMLTNCTLRTVYQSTATFVGPGELCVTTAGSAFFFMQPPLSALHGAYLHVVGRFQVPTLAIPSFPSTFVATSGSIVSIGQSVSIFAGLHLTLLCAVTRGNPAPNVQWTLNGNPLGNEDGGKHAIDVFHGTMTIFGVDQSDAGEYKCTAANIRGSTQAHSVLTVLTAEVSCMYTDTYNPCSAACGVGVQQRAVLCQRVFNGTTFPVDPQSLPISQRPAPSIRMCLSNQMCPTQSYAFHVGDYGPCSASCQGGRQLRSVSCMELYNGAPVRGVESFVCTLAGLEAPPMYRLCNTVACPAWLSGPYGNCSVRCGSGVRTRTVVCLVAALEDAILNDTSCNSGTKPAISEACIGTDCDYQWSASEWGECATGCMQTRAIVCVEASSRTEVDTSYCQQLRDPPFSQQPCNDGDCTYAK